MYWDIAVGQANSISAQYEVTLGVIYDANGRHGEDGAQALIDQTTAAMGGTPATGVNEIAWLNKFIAIRDVKLKIDGIIGVDLGGGVGLGTRGNGASKSPVVSFTASATTGTVPKVITFTDRSTNTPTKWSWKFGDGGTATTKIASHTYIKAGTYTVSLIATNAAGSATATKNNYIVISSGASKSPVAAFAASATSVKVSTIITFTDRSTNTPTKWSWKFGDGGTATVKNPTHAYTKAGKYTVSMAVYNAVGSNTATKTNYIAVA